MTIGLAINPAANRAATKRYRRQSGFWAYHAYAAIAKMKNSVLRTFFRSATHATDSTLSGCTANRAATSRLGPTRFVTQASSRNKSTELSA